MANRKFPPRSEWKPRVFRRAGTFYVIDLPVDDDLAEHARLNPGTLRIEDFMGNQLWPPALSLASEQDAALMEGQDNG
jgi:hypothetical protein